jgi:hypothetical protein
MTDEESPTTHGLSRRNAMRVGALGLGAAVVGIASPLLAAGSASALTNQPSWAYCQFCAGLWHYDAGDVSAHNDCPSPNNFSTHSAVTSYNYELPYPVTAPGDPQPGWAWCWKCGVLFYSPNQSQSVCPSFGNHDASESYKYGLNYYSSFPNNNPQGGWYWCNDCQGLWVVASGVTSYCPKNGASGHVIGNGSYDYGISWDGTFHPTPPT